MRLTIENGCFVCVCHYNDRHIPKSAGFKWGDPVPGRWATRDVRAAMSLSKYADDTCRDKLVMQAEQSKDAIEASWAAASDFQPPAPDGMEYMPFQRAGIHYIVESTKKGNSPCHGGVLLADDMGLGKTIQAIGAINCLNPESVLVVCPASLKLNWRDELKRWLVNQYDVTVLMPRSYFTRQSGGIWIINYDILQRFDGLYDEPWDMVILDEAHYCKSNKSLRFKCVRRLKAKHRLALTGTPFPNKPIEIQSVLGWLRPDLFGNRMRFAMRYCDAHQDHFGWKMDGATNREELNALLRTEVMVRRLKKDVLTELPPKIRQVIELPCDGLEDVLAGEWDAYNRQEEVTHRLKVALQLAKTSEHDHEYKNAVAGLRDGLAAAFQEMALMRLKVAKAKVPFILAHMEDIITHDHPVLCFAHHKEVVKSIVDGLMGHRPVFITGDTPIVRRHEHVNTFQSGGSDLFVGNMQAAGVGLTLTRSSHVVFAEIDWVPATMSQAEDRAHRIGQRDSVLVQHLVLEGSLDATMAKRLIEKQKVIDSVLNVRVGEIPMEAQEPISDVSDGPMRPATESVTRVQIAEVATRLSGDDVKFIHSVLKFLAGLDGDFARIKNDIGFNRMDAEIGHDLAGRPMLTPRQAALGFLLASKYHAQMDERTATRIRRIGQ